MSKQFALMGDDCERMKFVLEKNFTSGLHWKDFNFCSKVGVMLYFHVVGAVHFLHWFFTFLANFLRL